MAPTDCFEPAPPKIVQSICMKNGDDVSDSVPMPDDALVVTSQDGKKVEFTVRQEWSDENGMAIMYDETLESPTCVVKGNVLFGDSEDLVGECFAGATGVTVVVYMDASFKPEECEACDVDDLSEMGENFCAYRLEIPCEPTSVECGEPSTAPSGSYFPSSAPSDSPTKSPAPSNAPTNQPSASPTSQPSKAPSDQPSSKPSSRPSVEPSASPSSKPSTDPSESPSSKPSISPSNTPSDSPSSSPSLSPSNSPSNKPSGSPSNQPSSKPSGSPSNQPSSSPSADPSNNPTANPTASMAPTDCFEPAAPKVFDSICMTTSGETMDTIPLPENAIVVTNQIGGVSLDVTVSQQWMDEAGLAIRSGMDDCIVKSNMLLGSSEDFNGECLEGSTSVTIVVYLDANYNPEECDACNVDDLAEMGGENKFCAYRA